MFLYRRSIKKGSYRHLSESNDGDTWSPANNHLGKNVAGQPPVSPPSYDSAIKTVVELDPGANISSDPATAKSNFSLECAMAAQTQYTSWPGSIWEVNIDDADGEIVFDQDNEFCDQFEDFECDSRKSYGTLETEEDTMPSSCSSPEFQNTWELDDLDLSAIVMEEESDHDKKDRLTTNNKRNFDQRDDDNECALFACSAELKNNFLEVNRSPLRRLCNENSLSTTTTSSPGASKYFLIEESFAISEDSQKHEELSFCSSDPSRRKRSIRFADEEGKEMETVHVVDKNDEDDPTLQRLLILLLLPDERKYEFVHAEYNTNSRVSVSALLDQLPTFATDPIIADQQYCRLCRAACGSELINALSIQDYGLEFDEILIAVLEGYSGKAIHNMSRSLVENEEILRAVKRTHRLEHTLHRVKSNEELYGISRPRDTGTTSRGNSRRTGDDYRPSPQSDHKSSFCTIIEVNTSINVSFEVDYGPRRNIIDGDECKNCDFEDQCDKSTAKHYQSGNANTKIDRNLCKQSRESRPVTERLRLGFGFWKQETKKKVGRSSRKSKPCPEEKHRSAPETRKHSWTHRITQSPWKKLRNLGTGKKNKTVNIEHQAPLQANGS